MIMFYKDNKRCHKSIELNVITDNGFEDTWRSSFRFLYTHPKLLHLQRGRNQNELDNTVYPITRKPEGDRQMVTPSLISHSKTEVVSRGLDVCSESSAVEIKRSNMIVCFEKEDSQHRNVTYFDKRNNVDGFVVPNRIIKVRGCQHPAKDENVRVKDLTTVGDWSLVSNSNIVFDVIKGTGVNSFQKKILIDDADNFHDEQITTRKTVPRENLYMGKMEMPGFICDHNQSISSSNGDIAEDICDGQTMTNDTSLQQDKMIALGDSDHLKLANQGLLEESNSRFSALNSNREEWNPTCNTTRFPPIGISKSMPHTIMGKENKEAIDFLQSPQLSSRYERGDVQLFLDQKSLLLHDCSNLNPSPASSDHLTSSALLSYSRSNSYRSDSSMTSTRSFAFPVLQTEWNSSPVRMPHANRGNLRRSGGWRMRFSCFRF